MDIQKEFNIRNIKFIMVKEIGILLISENMGDVLQKFLKGL